MPRTSAEHGHIGRWTALALLTAVVAIVVAAAGFAVVEPQTGVGYAMFRLGYSAAPSRDTYLADYSDRLRTWNGGHLPSEVDAFLAQRWADGDAAEQHSVIAFHVSQGWGRTGSAFETLGERGIPPVLAYLDAASGRDEHRLVLGFLEGIRRADAFGKGGYCGDLPLPEVEALFRAWWDVDEPWAEKSARDPLAGHGLCWDEL